MTTDFALEIAAMRPHMERFSRHFTFNRDEAHELIQDTLVKALMYRDKFQQGTNLRGWLYTIMRNVFINSYRRSRKMRFSCDAVTERKVLSVADGHTFNLALDTLEYNEIWKDINNLRDDLKRPFKMHLTGYKYHEIADALNIPIGTVKNRIFHARDQIRTHFER